MTLELVLSREEVISRLRRKLASMTESGQSVCLLAGDRGIFCRGFAQFSDIELRHAYREIVNRNPSISRAELEREANAAQLDRQIDFGTLTSCDTQQIATETCRGWAEFSNRQLAQFYLELLGEEVVVTGVRV